MITPILTDLMSLYGAGIIGYFVLINLTYLLMLWASASAVLDYLRRTKGVEYRAMVQSGSTTPISVIAPAYNEAQTIVASLHSLLRLDYATMEVVAVNDGSKDETLEVLIREFALRRTHRMYVPHIRTKAVRGIYVSTREEWKHLVVVDKENGGKADALNAGVNVSRHPLFCAIDADSVLENDALLKVAKPFLEDDRVVAVGGIVRIANGCTVERGRVTEVRLPRKLIPLLQIVEYLRAFLSGRMGWSRLNALLIVSGAFGLFRKNVVVACGGYRHDTVGEDMELIARMHRYLLERRIPYRVVFVPDPVCWTEAPETPRVLGRQRNRWHRGLMDSLLIHRRMFMNPRYRQVGLLAMPYFVFFELLAPVIEISGYVMIPFGAAAGILDVSLLVTFFFVSVVYGVLFSLGAVLLEEISFHRYPKPRDLARLMMGAVVENFGYRQLTVWWRFRGIIDYMRGVQSWGAMQRTGFAGVPRP
jgi:cellulose synthase/poly-beta-1,6-N-acetylglucosamine synthase-like glycosyltransferase